MIKITKEYIDNFVWAFERAKYKTKYEKFPINTIFNILEKKFGKSDVDKKNYILIPFNKWFNYNGNPYSKLYSKNLKECLYEFYKI